MENIKQLEAHIITDEDKEICMKITKLLPTSEVVRTITILSFILKKFKEVTGAEVILEISEDKEE